MDKEVSDRSAHVRALGWRTLEALSSLIDRVQDPTTRAHLESRRAELLERLKQESVRSSHESH